MALASAKLFVQAVYFLSILAIGVIPNMSIDIYTSTQLIAANGDSAQTNSMFGLYLIGLLFLFLSLILFAVANPFSAQSARQLTLYSMIYAGLVAVLLTSSAYTQYQFNVRAFSVSASPQTTTPEVIWQTSVLRTILFIAGSPFIIYLSEIATAKKQTLHSPTKNGLPRH